MVDPGGTDLRVRLAAFDWLAAEAVRCGDVFARTVLEQAHALLCLAIGDPIRAHSMIAAEARAAGVSVLTQLPDRR